MKKYLILASAALVALAACNKEIEVQDPVNNTDEVVLTFTSERPQFEAGTKTAWDASNSCIVWEATDKIRVGYTLNGDWMGQTGTGTAKFYASKEVTIDDDTDRSVGTFKVPITGSGVTAFTDPETNGTYKFYAIYPSTILSNTTVDDPTDQSVTLATAQTPGSNTFDHSTDIMVGVTEDMSITGLPTDPIELTWTRVVAHTSLTFTNMGFVGTEVPSKITLTFNEAAKVAGTFSIDITDGTIGAGTANVIALEGSGLTVSGTSINAWATVLPVSFSSLKVEVKTDKATYTRNISSFTGGAKTFKQNARNTLTINMTNANRVATTEYDWVVKDLSAITSSDVFVIVGNNGDNYAMNHTYLNSKGAPNATAVTVTGTGTGRKLTTSPADALQWNLTSDSNGYVFYPNGDDSKWLNLIDNNNGLRVSNTASNGKYWTIDSSTGYLKGTDTANNERYIGIYSSTDWRSYKLDSNNEIASNIANQTFAFYVRTEATPSKPVPTISFGTPTTEVNIGESVTNTATISVDGLTITYSSSDDTIASVDASTGEVTGEAAGTATITASFVGNDTYDSASADYEITVVDPNVVVNDGTLAHPYTASEARELALSGDTGSYYISGIVTKVQNQYSASYGTANFWIDENGTSQTVFEGYKIKYFGDVNWVEGNAEIAVDDEVIIYGTLTVFNSTTPETSSGYLVSLNGKTKGLTPGTLMATPDNDNKQITVTWAAATGTTSAISYVVSCGTQTYNASAAGSHTFTMADYGQYNVSVAASADDAISGSARTTVTLSDPNSNTPTLQYTLDGTTTGGSSGYATESEITQNSITWMAMANTTMNPWRFGGKNLSSEDRAVYSTIAIASNISSIEVESGTATATVNSLTITVHNSDTDAANGTNAIATKSVTTGITSSTVTLTKEDATSWAGKYYRIVYNVTCGGSNQYVQFKSAKFYGTN